MRVLVACEFSGTVRDAFIAKGHDAMSCDLLPTESPGPHYQGDVMDIIDDGWDLMIAHPPCTFFANSGSSHLHRTDKSKTGALTGPPRWVAMFEAAEFFNKLLDADIPCACIENPTPHRYASALVGPYDQAIHPWQFGHRESKRTCLWLRNLPELMPTDIVDKGEGRIWKMGGSREFKNHARSIFYKGIAEAMADQWGEL